MVRSIRIAALCSVIAFAAAAQYTVGGWNPDEIEKVEETVAAFREKDDGLEKFFDKAHGYAVFPTVAKGAIGVGGAHGKGMVYEKGKPVGESTVTQVTIGFQLGGQAYSEIVFFQNKEAIDRFKEGKFEVAAQASAVAVTVGASADLAYNGGVAIMTMAKGGLMYEASIGGQKFSYKPFKSEDEGTKASEGEAD
jgi:lipid-binding SYLF domain-containing protein